jgi:hypothetical protein
MISTRNSLVVVSLAALLVAGPGVSAPVAAQVEDAAVLGAAAGGLVGVVAGG